MKKTLLKSLALLGFVTFSIYSYGQSVLMGDYGYDQASPANCGTFGVSGNNFFDDGAAGNYSANFNDTTVFCPDLTLGTKMALTFGINAGFQFDVDGTDSIYVYDGPNTSSPLIGVHNSVTDPTGFSHIASWSNPSGCLTVVFISDAGPSEGTGWIANVACGNQAQPFDPHIEAFVNGVGSDALNPADTGFVDICFGDSILFVAKPIFPHSLETTGFGYSQNLTNVDYNWTISDGGTYANNDSIWFTPPSRNGFLVDLKITDIFPNVVRMLCKVRVSILPSFDGTGPLQDSICLGDQTSLAGGVTPTDTVGVSIAPGSFQLGGSFAGLTYLPDGSGAQYAAPIAIDGFPLGSTITNDQDLNQVCITMEHSYLGDLEIALQCPTGQQVTLLNSYSPGFIGGGVSGGGTYMGDPIDDIGGGGPGEGWEYCFSSVFNTWGDYPTEIGLGNTVPALLFGGGNPSLNPNGVYLPETSFNSFIGCPVNGTWTIIVQDNLTIDDGYIFEWGLYFDPAYFPGAGAYQNSIASENWLPDPSIVSGMGDTLITVQPPTTGDNNYTYQITDDFGCIYDTTVSVNVLPLSSILGDTTVCDLFLPVTGTIAHLDQGTWFSTSPEISFTPSATVINPTVSTSLPGVYTIGFTDNACGDTSYVDITFAYPPEIFSDTTVCDLSYQVTGTVVDAGGGTWTSTDPEISFATSTDNNPIISATQSGQYMVEYTGNSCNVTVGALIEFVGPPSIFGDTLVCNDYVITISGTESYFGGVWSALDTTIHFNDTNFLNPDSWASVPGVYLYTFTDTVCNQSVSSIVTFPPLVWTDVEDTLICLGSEFYLHANNNWTVDNYVWNTGVNGPNTLVTEPGVYIVTASNVCYEMSVSATVEMYLCDIAAPNIISLSSTSGNNIWYVEEQGLIEFTCSIVNRWGNLIYEYSDSKGGWDGRTMAGNLVEEGTYFYRIDATVNGGATLQKHGSIQVVH
ncbi:MAG: gliding motility-associated C-terminal domain-containing protein [Crocinitomicaceae bacterium]|nr:gliding motility-associated C-terminal domain-containing protein [Crocinitomicaceae bacterium]